MLLSYIYDQLNHGEFAQLALGGSKEAGIRPEHYERLLAHVNLGLTELHKRFLLKRGTLKLSRVEGQRDYLLSKRFAAGNRESREPVKYILDSFAAPYQDDLLKIERVFDGLGTELDLNTGGNRFDPEDRVVRTPKYNLLQIPEKVVGDVITVDYRANHPIISAEDGGFDPAEVEIDLEESLLEPLLYFIASRVFNPIGLNQEFHDGNNFAAKFEASCKLIEQNGLSVDYAEEANRFQRGGWC